MEIEFEFKMDDWMEFQKDFLKYSKQYKRTKTIISAMFPTVFIVILLLEYLKGGFDPIKLLLYTIASILWVTFYPKRFYKTTLAKTKKNDGRG